MFNDVAGRDVARDLAISSKVGHSIVQRNPRFHIQRHAVSVREELVFLLLGELRVHENVDVSGRVDGDGEPHPHDHQSVGDSLGDSHCATNATMPRDPNIDALVKTVSDRETAYANFVKNNLGVRAKTVRRSNAHVRNMLELIMQKSTGQSSDGFFKKMTMMLTTLKTFADNSDDGLVLREEIQEALEAIKTLQRVFGYFEQPRHNPLRGVMAVVQEPLFDLTPSITIPDAPSPCPEDDDCRSDAWSDF